MRPGSIMDLELRRRVPAAATACVASWALELAALVYVTAVWATHVSRGFWQHGCGDSLPFPAIGAAAPCIEC